MFKGARLGIFIFIGTVLIIISVFLIGNKESLFVDTVNIYTRFTRVEGLKSGAPVMLSGLSIGTVKSIALSEDSAAGVIVTMSIEKDLINFVRLNSEATIETEGLVGKKIISISPGTSNYEIISEGGFIKSKEPLNFAEVVEETTEILKYVKNITKDFADIVNKVNDGKGTVGKLINSDQLYRASVDITKSADTSLQIMTKKLDELTNYIVDVGGGASRIFNNIDTVVLNIRSLVKDVEKGKGVLGALMADRSAYDSIKTVINNLVVTTESFKDGASAFTENMEALKHNWLFKNYFEQRGYWSLSEREKELDKKIEEVNKQTNMLQQRIDELKELEARLEKLRSENTR